MCFLVLLPYFTLIVWQAMDTGLRKRLWAVIGSSVPRSQGQSKAASASPGQLPWGPPYRHLPPLPPLMLAFSVPELRDFQLRRWQGNGKWISFHLCPCSNETIKRRKGQTGASHPSEQLETYICSLKGKQNSNCWHYHLDIFFLLRKILL